MSKYDPLCKWLSTLSSTGVGNVRMTFKQIEEKLESKLPDAARSRPEWWANEPGDARHPQQKAWTDAGFETRTIYLAGESVEFVKLDAAPRRTVQIAHTSWKGGGHLVPSRTSVFRK